MKTFIDYMFVFFYIIAVMICELADYIAPAIFFAGMIAIFYSTGWCITLTIISALLCISRHFKEILEKSRKPF